MKHLFLLIFLSLLSFSTNAQCKQGNPLYDKHTKGLSETQGDNDPYYSHYWCRRYYRLVCEAEKPTVQLGKQTVARTQQGARVLEDEIKGVIAEYKNSTPDSVEKLNP